MADSVTYMQTEPVFALPEHFCKDRKNRNMLCAFWAVIGECDNNASYMKNELRTVVHDLPLDLALSESDGRLGTWTVGPGLASWRLKQDV